MSEPQPVLVIGGTRGTGLLIARLLCQRGQRVRVLARDPKRATSLFDSSVEIVGGDLTKPETLVPAIRGARHLIRSEEHTSELQSHSFISYAVFCLKKKNT